jgi:hypothetical protein
VATRPPSQVYDDLRAAGFDAHGALIMTAIAGAESGYSTSARGDLALQSGTWGPSYGLFQVRTVKGDTGTGKARDINWLSADPANQAEAAYQISRGGQDFSPWSVYGSGAYKKFIDQANKAAGDESDNGPFPTIGPDWLPWNWAADAGNTAVDQAQALTGQALTGARNIALEGTFVLLGLAVVAAGAYLWVGGWSGIKAQKKAAQDRALGWLS